MKWFIAIPLTGKSDEEIISKRETAIKNIKKKDKNAIILDTWLKEEYEAIKDNAQGLKYLAKLITILSEADALYMLDGWQSSSSCSHIYDIANTYGLIMYFPKYKVGD